MPDAATPSADPEIARILVQQGGEDALRHHIADNLIAQGGSIPARVTLHALAE